MTKDKKSLNIDLITVGPFSMNSYIISDPDTSEAIFIDPGTETKRLIDRVEQLNLKLKYIVITHCHIDHIADSIVIQEHFNKSLKLLFRLNIRIKYLYW